MRRRTWLVSMGAALWPATAVRAQRGPWPDRPIRLVVPFAPGGTADLLARLVAEPLARQLGTPIVIDNRAGAAGALGTDIVAKAASDGYTIGIATQSTHAALPAFNASLAYDALRDFAPISMLAVVPGVLAVHPSLPVGSLPELIALAREQPGRLAYGTAGIGSLGHLLVAQVEQRYRIELLHVPYKSGAAALLDTLTGRLQIALDGVPPALPFLRMGRLNALAVMSGRRVAVLADVPTYAELGLGDIGRPPWLGVVAPAGTAPDIVERLNAAVHAAMNDRDLRATLARSGSEPAPGTPDAFALEMRATLDAFRAVVAAGGIAPEVRRSAL